MILQYKLNIRAKMEKPQYNYIQGENKTRHKPLQGLQYSLIKTQVYKEISHGKRRK